MTVVCSVVISSGAVNVAVDSSPTLPSTVTESEASPDGAAALHRSTTGGADGLASVSGALDEQPARRTAESATAERATSGRMRTVNLRMKGKGSLHLLPHFL
jgi:hypothetical protein